MVKYTCLFLDGEDHLQRESRQLYIHWFGTVLLGTFVLYFYISQSNHCGNFTTSRDKVGCFLLVLWFHAPKKNHDRISHQSTKIEGLNSSTQYLPFSACTNPGKCVAMQMCVRVSIMLASRFYCRPVFLSSFS